MLLKKLLLIAIPVAAMAFAGTASGAGNYVLHDNLYYNLTTTPYTGEAGVLEAAVSPKDGKVNFDGNVYSGDIKVPGFITVNGQKYAVTSVANNCFAYQKDVTSIEIPATIRKVGSYAFASTAIRTMTLPAAVTEVDMALFSRCDSLKTITSLATVPPKAPTALSIGLNTPWVTVYVPAGSVDAYKAADGWSLFVHIETMLSEQIKPTSITLDPAEYKGYIDSRFKVTATVLPENAENKNYTFSSSNPAIATVDAEGNVRLVGEGVCDILATSEVAPDVKGVCTVTSEVDRRVYPKEVVFTPEDANLPVGQKFRIEAKVLPENAFDKRIEFRNLYPEIASVDSLGNVECLKSGVTMITVMSAFNHQIGGVLTLQVRSDTVIMDGMRYKYFPEDATAMLLGPVGESPANVQLKESWPGGFSDKRHYTLKSIAERAFAEQTSLKEISIPATVDSIGLAAFNECLDLGKVNIPAGIRVIAGGVFAKTNLKSIEIPDNVYMIDNQAFNDCPALEEIKIGSGLKMICLQAFDKCEKISRIECKAVAPPAFFEASVPAGIELNPFSKSIYEKCVIVVPVGSAEAYRSAKVWKDFKNIMEFDFDGIEDVNVDENAPVRYFNLQGVEVSRPEKGIYIRVQGSKSTRIYIGK